MTVNRTTDAYLHSKLPIDQDEKILAVYKHHWFAYASLWIIGGVLIALLLGIAVIFSSVGGDGTSSSGLSQNQSLIVAGAAFLSLLVGFGTILPVYLRSQEQIVLTEEAILQILQPSLFASKVSQLSLQHIADVSVQQDFFGSILGFGYITVETPGEQNNYKFAMLPDPHTAAREIIAAHENFDAALQAGRIKTTLGSAEPAATPQMQIDPNQYQQFLQYQQMVAQQQAQAQAQQQAAQNNDPTKPQA